MTKRILGFTALGVGTYLAYKNMDKIKAMTAAMTELMKDEAYKLEDMIYKIPLYRGVLIYFETYI